MPGRRGGCSAPSTSQSVGPWLTPLIAPAAPGASSADDVNALAAALLRASVPSNAWSRIVDTACAYVASREASAIAVFDAFDDDPTKDLDAERGWLLPMWTCAENLASTSFRSGNGSFFELSSQKKDARSVRLWDADFRPSSTPDARTRCWAAAHALLVRLPSEADRRRAAADLRADVCKAQSKVGLVVETISPAAVASTDCLSDRMQRKLAEPADQSLQTRMLRGLMGAPSVPTLRAFVLEPNELLVCCRLGFMAQRAELVAHVRQIVGPTAELVNEMMP